MEMPETRYARSGDVNIAYQVFGDGDTPLVWIPGFTQHLELNWEESNRRAWFEGLGRFARVVTLDKRGTGLSGALRCRRIQVPVSRTPLKQAEQAAACGLPPSTKWRWRSFATCATEHAGCSRRPCRPITTRRITTICTSIWGAGRSAPRRS